MVRICFSRKNKTLAAIFKTKGVLEILEKNYATFCSLNGQEHDPTFSVKDKVLEILEQTGNAENRSGKMDQDDFLKYAPLVLLPSSPSPPHLLLRLLVAFNKAGIHFA